MITTRDGDGPAAVPRFTGNSDDIDPAGKEVDAFEQEIRSQDRRRRTITAVVVTLALAGAITFVAWAIVTRPRSKYSSETITASRYTRPPSPSSEPAIADAELAPPRPEPTAPHPSKLPVCDDPKAPLALRAMCQLGAPAASAAFECEHPEVGMIWPGAVSWRCPPERPRRARSISVDLIFDREGDMLRHGEVVIEDDPRTARRGVVRKVSITLSDLDRAAASEQVEHLLAAARGWGCVEVAAPPYLRQGSYELDRLAEQLEREREESKRQAMAHEVDCGAQWKIRVRYIDVRAWPLLIFEAGSPLGFELTDPGAAPFSTSSGAKL